MICSGIDFLSVSSVLVICSNWKFFKIFIFSLNICFQMERVHVTVLIFWFFFKFSSAWTKLVPVNHCEISTEFLHVFTVIYVLYIPIRTLAANRHVNKNKNILKCLIHAEACMLDYYIKKNVFTPWHFMVV